MKYLRILFFVIVFLIALKIIFIVGWLLRVAVLLLLIGLIVWFVKSLFGKGGD